jgi:hypothetical protein
VTNEQLNAAAAKCLGWEPVHKSYPEDTAVPYWTTSTGRPVRIEHYKPASNLTQAWEFARAKDLWDWEMDRDWARVWMAPNRAFSEPHDGTPQDAARALTVCVLRANGVEV